MALFRCASGSSGGGATITVTYSSDFYGETVTCSHGTKTYSKVATSSGTLEFSVDEEGTWTISCTIGSDTFSTTADVDLTYDAELVSLPNGETVLPTDDIETWLACAAITDKAYTTLSQVLGDSETYNALLGDSNACAYMKRSTTWSTDICADQYAMNLLGQYDTACDALLSDSTWASAICNSTYFESVLSPLVPTMTGFTTPKGEVFPNNGSSYSAYHAFDGTGRVEVNYGSYGRYIGYKFTEPIKINVAIVNDAQFQSGYKILTYKIVGSNNGTDWTDLSDVLSYSGSVRTIILNNTSEYLYYALYGVTYADNTIYQISTIQFYGRASSGEKIHGGNPTYDSFYRIVDGNNVPVTDPSLLDAGTYTIYSNGLAKNPSDLSADYGKTIRICPNTKEIVVRPDNSLYWRGYESWNLEDNGMTNGTSYSLSPTSPVHNDTSILINYSGAKTYSFVNTKLPYTGTIKAIVKADGNDGYGITTVKTFNAITEHTIASTETTYSYTLNNEYYLFGSWNNRAGYEPNETLYALWYE